jgi:hypothetical protein
VGERLLVLVADDGTHDPVLHAQGFTKLAISSRSQFDGVRAGGPDTTWYH